VTGPKLAKSFSWRGNMPGTLFLGTILVVLGLGILLSWHSMGVLDIWLHNHVGREILAGDGFPRVNSYSFTEPEHTWTNHEWLFQVLVALAGPGPESPADPGIERWNLLRILLSALLLTVLLLGDGIRSRINSRSGPGWGWPWLGLPLLLGLLLLWPRLILRPELVSYLFLVLLTRTLDRPLATWTPAGDWRDLLDPRRPLGRTLLLTILWAQFHGFSALAPALFVLAALSRFPELGSAPGNNLPRTRPASLWLLALPLLLAGLCLTPNGLQGLLYPLQALGQFKSAGIDLRTTISELAPLLETRDSLGLTLAAYRLSLVWGLAWIIVTWGRTSVLRILLWVLAAWAAWAGQRNIGFYAIAFLLLHTGTSGFPLARRLPIRTWRLPGRLLGPLGAALTILLSVSWDLQIINDDFYLREGVSRRFGAGTNPGRYPETAAGILASRPGTRLFSDVDSADFLLDRAGARLFIDGRTEAYSPGHWAAYTRIKRGDEQALALLAKTSPERVFLSAGGGGARALTRALLRSDRWFLARYEAGGFLFQPREDTALPTSAHQASGADFSSLGNNLPGRGTSLSRTRAADLCLSWAIIMEVGNNPVLQEQALRRGLEFRPDHPHLQHNLGNLLLARGQPEEALALFTGALDRNPRLSGSALNAGVCNLRLGRADAARQLFHRAISIDPHSFEAWANLGMACQALGDNEGARKALGRALQLRPNDRRLRQMLLRIGS